jgi:hypothetical protein
MDYQPETKQNYVVSTDFPNFAILVNNLVRALRKTLALFAVKLFDRREHKGRRENN